MEIMSLLRNPTLKSKLPLSPLTTQTLKKGCKIPYLRAVILGKSSPRKRKKEKH
jgi:hypothetical protein